MTTVLIIDQSQFQRKRLCNIMQDLGITVVGELTSTKAVIEHYSNYNSDLIIMSVTDSSKETNDTIKAITDYNPQVKIIIISNLGFQNDIQEYLNSGAKDFIIKPYQIEDIERVCNSINI